MRKHRVIAFIPARGGSKSIPLKNIRRFAGKPLIAWSILAAKNSKYIDRIIVSTDSPRIGKVARRYGAETPYLQPSKLAGDRIPVEPVIRYALEWLRTNESYTPDAVVLLMPPTPSRLPSHIDAAVRLFFSKKVDSVLGVNETPANNTPYWTLVRNTHGKVTLFDGKALKHIIRQRQLFPQKCYGRNDLVYVFKPDNLFQKTPNLYGDKVELLETDPKFQMDINTPGEWDDAEIKFRRLRRNGNSRA